MTVQDDARERELLELFALRRPAIVSRSGVDAVLDLDGEEIPFELKSTTNFSVTTVRDFGPDHVAKWRDKHWLVGCYDADGRTLLYSLYSSPKKMAPWIEAKSAYVKPDFDLVDLVPGLIGRDIMFQVLGKKGTYTLEEARQLHKKQYTSAQYKDMMDKPGGYSQEQMLRILQARCRYLINRGATLNNPHIPASYFAGWEQITDNHAARLRELVREAAQDNA